ncbi:MAG: TMEM165/GDT1 family protein [Actinobacteria bacterium]|nr:TMEM165/GDT1 family protein [Actinomycetota bacterium]
MLASLSGADLALFISVFLACAVETVEAVTIVLAAGTSRNWKSTFQGVISALIVLVILVSALGPSIEKLPEHVLQLVVGGLMLIFGMQWLRKAILRAGGFKALHDEEKIYLEEINAAQKVAKVSHFVVTDWYAFTLAFKGVLLEGLEVVFIVVTFGVIQKGNNPQALELASWAAIIAVVIVTIAGFAIHKPLSRVPENTMKFIVGILLTSFGIFWGAEGAGAQWPHQDLSLIAIIGFVIAICVGIVEILKVRKVKNYQVRILNIPTFSEPTKSASPVIRWSGAFLYFWYDFIIGDDWRVAAAIVLALFSTHTLGPQSWWLMPLVVAGTLIFTLLEASAEAPSDTSR